ncbi:MAG: hypothetical protein KAX40_01665 [Herpetosiphon sp.]|nr:hypothetical protein [Herpetosiphon sp.]
MKTIGKWLAIVVIAFAIVIGGQAISTSFAQSNTESTQSTQAKPDKANKRGERAKQALTASLVHQTAELTNLEHKAVVQQLKDGASLSEIASANGSSEQAVIDASIAKIDERLSKAVANGKITDDQKAQALEKARAEAPAIMNDKDLKLGDGKGKGQKARQALIQATAEVTGLTPEHVRAEYQAGKSLEQIAQEHGKTADDIVANLRTKGETKLEEMLTKAREAITKVPSK